MKIKVSKNKLNIHYRGSPRGSRTQRHAYCLRYAHSQHIESHLGKKQQQAKIPIAFLFRQLHFNNITSPALFSGGHLVMRSKRCAVQNQGITLNASSIKRDAFYAQTPPEMTGKIQCFDFFQKNLFFACVPLLLSTLCPIFRPADFNVSDL